MIRHILTAMVLVSTTLTAQTGRRTPPVPPTPPTPPARAERPARPERPPRLIEAELARIQREIEREVAAPARAALQQAVTGVRHGPDALAHLNELARVGTLTTRQSVACVNTWGPNMSGPRFPADAADSLYQRARSLINAGDYRAAIQRLGELQQRHTNSRCAAPGMYYHAFSLYRIGGDADLRQALTILDTHRSRFPNVSMASEVSTLATRIRAQLAQRGDASAQAALRSAANGSRACDAEEQAVRSEALRGLLRIDPDAAMPKLRTILEQQDACIELRRSALSILGSRREESSLTTLIATARNDSSATMRADAASYVAQYGTEASAAALESIVRNDASEQVRRSAARSLVGHASPRARAAARALVEDNTVSDNIRLEMLMRYTAERAAPEDAAWLRAAFPRATSTRAKQGIVAAVTRIGRTEDQAWLMELSVNDAESSTLRAEAFRGVSLSMTVPQLAQAYDNSGSTAMREQILRALHSRTEPAAGDKMLEVVRRGTDPRLRSMAIELLMQKKDPRLTAALLELIDR